MHARIEFNKQSDDVASPPIRRARWPWILGGTAVAACVAVVLLVLYLPDIKVKTDDAYVVAHYAAVAPRVSGQVAQVAVKDNEVVKRGQLLVVLDPTDFQAELDQANATLDQDLATVAQAQAQVDRQPAVISQAQAMVRSAEAAIALSRANADRYKALSQIGAGSVQQRQQYDARLKQDEATLQSAQAGLTAAQAELAALRAAHVAALSKVEIDRARARQATLNLSYTRITAPFDGVVDQRAVQVGNFVSPGAAMLAVVPLQDVWIEANYRELDLQHMRPGQSARVHVDAYDVWLDGVVQSVAPSSGVAYSPMPPNNATGNFTKIVQRLPVKIVLNPNQPGAKLLHVGMSVETIVDTGSSVAPQDFRKAGGDVADQQKGVL